MKQTSENGIKTERIFIFVNYSSIFKSERHADSVKVYKNNMKQKIS